MKDIFYLLFVGYLCSIVGYGVLIWQLRRDLTREIQIRHDEVDGLMNCIRALLEAQKLTTDTMGKIETKIK